MGELHLYRSVATWGGEMGVIGATSGCLIYPYVPASRVLA